MAFTIRSPPRSTRCHTARSAWRWLRRHDTFAPLKNLHIHTPPGQHIHVPKERSFSLRPASRSMHLQVCGAMPGKKATMPGKKATRESAQEKMDVASEESSADVLPAQPATEMDAEVSGGDALLTSLQEQTYDTVSAAARLRSSGVSAHCCPDVRPCSSTGDAKRDMQPRDAARLWLCEQENGQDRATPDAIRRLQSAVGKVQTVLDVQRALKRTPQRTGLVEGFHAVVPDGLPPESVSDAMQQSTSNGARQRLELRTVPSLSSRRGASSIESEQRLDV